MHKLSLEQLTLLKRGLTIIGALLIAIHMVTAAYVSHLDRLWYMAHYQWEHSFTNIALGFANAVLYGMIFIAAGLALIYQACKIEYKSRSWQRTVFILMPWIVAVSAACGYVSMLHDIAADIRPETAAEDGFFIYWFGSFSGAALLLMGFMLVDIVKSLWAPATEKPAVTYTPSGPDTETKGDDTGKTSTLLIGLGLGWLLGLFN